jgi:NADH:ubiquinone oxidoreductase subunit 6 (subunit J)
MCIDLLLVTVGGGALSVDVGFPTVGIVSVVVIVGAVPDVVGIGVVVTVK